jgi:hypothetical protein
MFGVEGTHPKEMLTCWCSNRLRIFLRKEHSIGEILYLEVILFFGVMFVARNGNYF